ncbi:MAG: glucosyltransferase domain-containing protein [Erysipelotrichaceae bacterium]|nr:glucosyltransferase domain-containing protein [Erysipelotrichaceae bacterium]
MGTGLLMIYKEKTKKEWKIAFLATVIIGFLVHTYMFTNSLLNHDALYNLYSDQNMVGSGRWFLSIACGLSSYFSLPWVIGVISILFISLTSVVVVDIFNVKNPIVITIISGLLVTFPAITETFFFEFTADGYMVAMFLAALSVRFSIINSKKKGVCFSIIFICLSCAIYQAYVSFALMLAISYFIVEVLENRHSLKTYLCWIRNQCIIYIAGMIIYYIIWKICLSVQSYEAASYMGMDSLGISIHSILLAVYQSIRTIIFFFIEYNFIEHGLTVYTTLNLIFLITLALIAIFAIMKSKLYQRKMDLLLCALATIITPFVICIWYFASSDVTYSAREEQSICLIFILAAVLAERWLTPKWSSAVGIILAAIIINNSVTANVFYYYMNRCNQKTYATAIEISTRVHELDDGTITSIVIIGGLDTWSDEDYLDSSVLGSLGVLKSVDENLLTSQNYVALYLKNIIDFELAYYVENSDVEMPTRGKKGTEPVSNGWTLDFPLLSDEEKIALLETEEYQSMSCYPSSNSIVRIGDSIIIKLSEPL